MGGVPNELESAMWISSPAWGQQLELSSSPPLVVVERKGLVQASGDGKTIVRGLAGKFR